MAQSTRRWPANFRLVKDTEIPDEWKVPAEAAILAHVAEQYKVPKVKRLVLVEIPESALGWAYQTFVQATSESDSVMVMLSNAQDFEREHGEGSGQITLRSLQLHGKPCLHMAAIYVEDP